MLYFILGVLALWAGVLTYGVYRRVGFTEEGWRQIRAIVFRAVDRGVELYRSSQMGLDEVVDVVVGIIYEEIQASPIPVEDKRFWSKERIRAMVRPVLEGLLAKIGTERQPQTKVSE